MTPKEIEMKPIPGYTNYSATVCGKIYSHKTNKYIKESYDKQGYARVGIYIGRVNGKYLSKTIKIHRLVAIAWLDNPNNLRDVNHINGIKSDNNVHNLEWCSHSDNIKHAFRIGLKTITQKQIDMFRFRGKKNTGGRNPAARKVIDNKSGKIFDTVSSAADYVKMNRTTLIAQLSGQNTNKTTLEYMD